METTKTSQAGINSALLFNSFFGDVQKQLDKLTIIKVHCPRCKQEVFMKAEKKYVEQYGFCFVCDERLAETDELAAPIPTSFMAKTR